MASSSSSSSTPHYSPIAFNEDDEQPNPTASRTEGYRPAPSASSVYEPLEIADVMQQQQFSGNTDPRKRSLSFLFGVGMLGMLIIGAVVQYSGRGAQPAAATEFQAGMDILEEGEGFLDGEGKTYEPVDLPEDWEIEEPKEWDISMHPIAKDLAYYREHANEVARPYSLLMIRNAEGYCLLSDDAQTSGVVHRHVTSFDLIYKSCEYDKDHDEHFRKVTLSYEGTSEPFSDVLSHRMQDSVQVERRKILKWEVVVVVHDDEVFGNDTYILWQEGDGTWQLRCDEMPWEECLQLGTDNLKEMSPEQFLDALDHHNR